MSLKYHVRENTNEVEVFDESKPLQVLVLPEADSRAVLIRGGGLEALKANALAKLKTAVSQAPELLPEIEEVEELEVFEEPDPESPELAPEVNASSEATPPDDEAEAQPETKSHTTLEENSRASVNPEDVNAHSEETTSSTVEEVTPEEKPEAVFSGAHSGDPCIYCGAGHDEVEIGDCPGPASAEDTPPDGGKIHALSPDSDVEETTPDDGETSPGEEISEDAAKISEKPASKTKKKTPKPSKKSEKSGKPSVKVAEDAKKSEAPAEKEDASETNE